MRSQEFIELVRDENYSQAIKYAQKYLAPWGESHMEDLQRVMAVLAFKRDTKVDTYKVILAYIVSNQVLHQLY